MFSYSDEPLLLLKLRVRSQDKLLVHFLSLEDDLKCKLPLCSLIFVQENYAYLFIQVLKQEVVQGVELPRVIVPFLLRVEVDEACIGKNTELLGPFISLEDSVSAFPDVSNLKYEILMVTYSDTNEIDVLEDKLNEALVNFQAVIHKFIALFLSDGNCTVVLSVDLLKVTFGRQLAI